MSKKFNAIESLWYRDVKTFPVVARPQIGVSHYQGILQEIRSAWWQPPLLVNECLVRMVMSWTPEGKFK